MKTMKSIEPEKAWQKPAAFQPVVKAERWSHFAKFAASLLAATTLIGVVALAVLPRVSVDFSAPLEPTKAFSAAFSVFNTNIIPLNHVNVLIGICRVDMNVDRPFDPRLPRALTIRGDSAKFTPGSEGCTGPNGAPYHDRSWANHNLVPDEKFSARLDRVFDWITPLQVRDAVTVTYADITVLVQFQPWVLPWQRQFEFRFMTQKGSDGTLHWRGRTLEDK